MPLTSAAPLSRRLCLLLGLSSALLLPPAAHAQAPAADAALPFKAPAPVRIAYDVEGVIGSPYTGSAELVWAHDGKRYQSQLLIRKFGLTLQAWTSQGALGERGLEPDIFTSKRLGQSEINARFQRTTGRVVFSEGTPDAALQSGAQDQLSVFMQLASLLAGSSTSRPVADTGPAISLQAIGDRYAEQWSFKASKPEAVKLAGGSVQAVKFTHEPTAERKQRLELWYAASQQFLPVRIRITESNGDFLDLLRAVGPNP
ncbi:DUF3108 domain-containing protein [Rhodoferax bucti]|uniref:DUF3108 domain-containing protein n=1 Tax=Rhodoferax bucti TaxID=2576305 RepID=UPI001107ED22|nr:DUF3108 domain-containing protein [Rhodoferax bucti]